MAQLESAATARIPSPQQQAPSTPPSLSMEVHDLSQPVTAQGKQATIHDFLSLCGTGASSTSVVAVSNNGSPISGGFVNVVGSQQSVTTQDLLQPLQKSLSPDNRNLLPNGFVLNASKLYGTGDPCAGQQNSYVFGNGSFAPRENFSSKYRPTSINFGAKGLVPHAIPLNKHWQQQQQQQQQGGLEVLDGNKRVTRIPSEEDDDDDDDESFDHGYTARKGSPYQKSDSIQQLEGKFVDNKGATPRSKHSATEQRRRSKINDRFQMLRQLLPNADQKRDKASFLLEVIEHIQMLHEKVKKYEGGEYRGQHQERTKVLSWDRNAGQQDVTYISTHDAKDVPDTNGFMRSRLSPLRVMSEDGVTNPELMCSMVQACALQTPAYLLNYESKPLISKPISLTFSQPPGVTALDQVSNPVYQNITPEGQAVFGHLLRQEEQAAMEAKCLLSNKVDIVPAHVQQARDVSIAQASNQVPESNFQKSRSIEQNLAILNFRRPDDEVEGRTRFSQMPDVSSTSKESGNDVNKLTYGSDGKGVHGANDALKAEQTSEVLINEQEAPAVLGGGVINISSVYSQGLLDTLTRALQSSGVDMAQATISVQIDLGKPEGSGLACSKKKVPLHTGSLPFQNKVTASSQESEHAKKRLKIEAD